MLIKALQTVIQGQSGFSICRNEVFPKKTAD